MKILHMSLALALAVNLAGARPCTAAMAGTEGNGMGVLPDKAPHWVTVPLPRREPNMEPTPVPLPWLKPTRPKWPDSLEPVPPSFPRSGGRPPSPTSQVPGPASPEFDRSHRTTVTNNKQQKDKTMKKQNKFALAMTTIGVSAAAMVGAAYADGKDSMVVQTPNGQCFKVSTPHNAATVQQNGNSMTVTKNPDAMKKIEIKPIPCPTPTPAPQKK